MQFSNHPKSIDSLLYKLGQAEKLAKNPQPALDSNPSSNFFLIFSVQEVVEFKQDAHKLVRRLSTLCALVSSCLTAAVVVWLLEVLSKK